MVSNADDESFWRRCSSCKRPIGYQTIYWTCSVSTCNRKRSGFVFCSVSCWDVHMPTANHRGQVWAEETLSPPKGVDRPEPAASAPTRTPVSSSVEHGATASAAPVADLHFERAENEILIVASRLKNYIKARSGMNCSDRALEPLSKIVRAAADDAIRTAHREGRKTVLDRDVSSVAATGVNDVD